MTNDELHQRLRVLEAHAGQQAQRVARLERQRAAEQARQKALATDREPAASPDIKSFFIGHPPGRRELLARIEVLEMRMDSQEGRLSGLVLREAAVRRARIREAQASEEDIAVHLVKRVSFRLNFTVTELAGYFEVNPEAVRANRGAYARKMADRAVMDFVYDEPGRWPKAITTIKVLPAEVAEIR